MVARHEDVFSDLAVEIQDHECRGTEKGENDRQDVVGMDGQRGGDGEFNVAVVAGPWQRGREPRAMWHQPADPIAEGMEQRADHGRPVSLILLQVQTWRFQTAWPGPCPDRTRRAVPGCQTPPFVVFVLFVLDLLESGRRVWQQSSSAIENVDGRRGAMPMTADR